jgi:hypothetical protein
MPLDILVNVETARDALDDFGGHLPVIIVMPDGSHREVAEITSATTTGGVPAAAFVVGDPV